MPLQDWTDSPGMTRGGEADRLFEQVLSLVKKRCRLGVDAVLEVSMASTGSTSNHWTT